MFSIGILGFIVWSQFSFALGIFLIIKIFLEFLVVALLFCEEKVKIFANCRQFLMFIDTLNESSKNLIRKNQAARNINVKKFISSSETKRETSFNFNLLKNIFKIPENIYTKHLFYALEPFKMPSGSNAPAGSWTSLPIPLTSWM